MTSEFQLQVLIATGNPGKVLEIREALSTLPIRLRQLDEFPNVTSVVESGNTYQENAVLKALGYAQQTKLCALADDSGLEVGSLNGKPGVFSARYGGKHLSDRERTQELLEELAVIGDSDRSARFVCSMALAGWQYANQGGSEPRVLNVTEGVCAGVLTSEPRGVHGFGFDPIFMPDGYDQTFGELAADVKDKISHRAKALQAMRRFLSDWTGKLDPVSARP